MFFKSFFWAKMSDVPFISFENCSLNIVKEATKWHEMMWVSNYRYPITKSSNWIPATGHPCDCTPITCQIGVRRTNHNQIILLYSAVDMIIRSTCSKSS